MYFSLIVLFIWQLYDTFSPNKIFSFFIELPIIIGPNNYNDLDLNRLFYSPGISLLCLYTSLYFLISDDYESFNKKYLSVIAGISFASIYLTATRGYILQYLFVLITFTFLNIHNGIKILIYSVIILMLANFLYPPIGTQINLSFDRLMTLQSLYEGDVTANKTLVRITERAPRVWDKYLESPVVGFGYSEEGIEYNDDHVGNYTLLLQGGILGAFAWLFVICSIVYSLFLKRMNSNKSKNLFFFSIAFILGLLIAHSTSSAVFSYYLFPHMTAVLGLFLIFVQRELYNIEN